MSGTTPELPASLGFFARRRAGRTQFRAKPLSALFRGLRNALRLGSTGQEAARVPRSYDLTGIGVHSRRDASEFVAGRDPFPPEEWQHCVMDVAFSPQSLAADWVGRRP
jgi:hypothetical protein